nr:hypothetical protein [bacterium]
RRQVIKLAEDEGLRLRLGDNLKRYLDHVVSWEIVARQYNEAYQLARASVQSGQPVVLDLEF